MVSRRSPRRLREESGTKRELNALDDKTGLIETVEREQIVTRIEELAAVVGLSNQHEKLTGHRDW